MRTTFDLDDELFRQAKKRAVEENTSLKAIVESALRSYLAGGAAEKKPYEFKWTPERGMDHPDIDWSDWASVKRFFAREDEEYYLRRAGLPSPRRKK